MKMKFGLMFDARDDGTKVWAAECQKCGALLVEERYPQVTVVALVPGAEPIPLSQFTEVRQRIHHAWDQARRTGNPIVIMDDRFMIASTNDCGDLQRALEAHAESCGAT